jgi:hypothetical protein
MSVTALIRRLRRTSEAPVDGVVVHRVPMRERLEREQERSAPNPDERNHC